MAKIAQIESYIAYQKSVDKSPATLSSYRSDLLQFAAWFLEINKEDLRLAKITPTDARQYKHYLVKSGFKPQTINRRLLSLKYFIRWGVDTKRIKYQFPLPKPVKQVYSGPKWLDKRQQNQLLRYAERYGQLRDIAIIKILLNTGLRVSELCTLTWNCVSIDERKGKLDINAGKGNKYREVPLNKDARQALIDLGYKQNVALDKPVIMGQRGALSPRGIQLMLKRLLKNSDLGVVSPHQLRHSFCKNLVDAEVSLEKMAALAGHEQLETTKIYCRPSFGDLSQAVEKIGELE